MLSHSPSVLSSFADTTTILVKAYIRFGRVLNEEGSVTDAMRQHGQAVKGQPRNVLAGIDLAQTQLKLDQVAAAMHSVEALFEATAMLASLSAVAQPGQSSSEIAHSKVKARELYDTVCKALQLPEVVSGVANGTAKALTRSQRKLADEVEMHLKIARLWHDDDHGRVEHGLQEAFRLSEAAGTVDP